MLAFKDYSYRVFKSHLEGCLKTAVGCIAVLAIALSSLTLSGCTQSSPKHLKPSSATSSASDKLVDPLSEITDPSSSVFVDKRIVPLLHAQGRGSHTYQIPRPKDSGTDITFYVSCVPQAGFVVTMHTIYSGECASRFLSSGAFPAGEWGDGSTLRIALKVPRGVRYWLVGVQEESGTS